MKKFGSSRNFLSKISRSTKIHKPASTAKGMRSYRNHSDNRNLPCKVLSGVNFLAGTYSDETDSLEDQAEKQYEMFREMYKAGHDPSVIKSTMESAGLDPRAILSRADLLNCRGQSVRGSRIRSMRSQESRSTEQQGNKIRRSLKKKKRNVIKNPKFRRQPSTSEVPIPDFTQEGAFEDSTKGAFQSGRNMSYFSVRDRNTSFNEVLLSETPPPPAPVKSAKNSNFMPTQTTNLDSLQNELQNTLTRRKKKNIPEENKYTPAKVPNSTNIPPPPPPRRNKGTSVLRRAPTLHSETSYTQRQDQPSVLKNHVSATFSQVTTQSKPARGFLRKEVKPALDNKAMFNSSRSIYQAGASNKDVRSFYSKASTARIQQPVSTLNNARQPVSRVSGTFSQVTTASHKPKGFLRKESRAPQENATQSLRWQQRRQGSKGELSTISKPAEYRMPPASPRIRKTFIRRENTIGTGSVISKAPPPGSLASGKRKINRSSDATHFTAQTSNRAYFQKDISSAERSTRYNPGKPRSVGTESTDQATSAITSIRNTGLEPRQANLSSPNQVYSLGTQESKDTRTLNQYAIERSVPVGSGREKNGVELKQLPYDSAVFKPFKAMQIAGRPPKDVILALESAGLDPSALYPQGGMQSVSTKDLWDLKYSKSFFEHYYKHRKTGEVLWKREVDNFLKEIEEKEAQLSKGRNVDFGPTITDEDI